MTTLENIFYYKDYIYNIIRCYIQPYIYTMYTGSKITENIYISDFASSLNKEKLQEEGITHILSTVLGVEPIFPDDFIYKNIYIRDTEKENIEKYFDECADFIKEAIDANGKILVHCSYGISRSASIVIAYLIKYEGKKFREAYDYLKEKREIIEPNRGFRTKLIVYELENTSL